MEQNHSFEYTYSAPQQEEVRKIREKYLPREEDKMERLRRLDRSAAQKGTVWSLVLGILGALVMGTGMSMCLVWGDALLFPGILVGIIGIGAVAAAYPVYARITRREREKLAPEILRLTEELMQ